MASSWARSADKGLRSAADAAASTPAAAPTPAVKRRKVAKQSPAIGAAAAAGTAAGAGRQARAARRAVATESRASEEELRRRIASLERQLAEAAARPSLAPAARTAKQLAAARAYAKHAQQTGAYDKFLLHDPRTGAARAEPLADGDQAIWDFAHEHKFRKCFDDSALEAQKALRGYDADSVQAFRAASLIFRAEDGFVSLRPVQADLDAWFPDGAVCECGGAGNPPVSQPVAAAPSVQPPRPAPTPPYAHTRRTPQRW